MIVHEGQDASLVITKKHHNDAVHHIKDQEIFYGSPSYRIQEKADKKDTDTVVQNLDPKSVQENKRIPTTMVHNLGNKIQ